MTRAEHLQWAKTRALNYVDSGDLNSAWASMVSDLRKNDELREHIAINVGTMYLMNGHLDTPAKMREFIEGFN